MTTHPLIRQLRNNARRLATAEKRVEAIRDERRKLWREGTKTEGVGQNEMARASGVDGSYVALVLQGKREMGK